MCIVAFENSQNWGPDGRRRGVGVRLAAEMGGSWEAGHGFLMEIRL